MATTTFPTGRSEDEVGDKVDRCLTDALIKTGAGGALGAVFSILLFKRRGWPVAFGVGTGLGMAVSNCQHQFKQLLPKVSLAKNESTNVIEN